MYYNPEDLIPLTLNIGYAEHYADWNWKNVRSPFARLYYITEGEAYVQLPDMKIHLKPGFLYFIPSFTLHTDICDKYFAHYYIHLYEETNSESQIFENLNLPYEVKAQEFDLDLIKKLCEMNPTMRLPQSNPNSYDNTPSLLENIRKNKMRNFSDRVECRGIIYILLSRFLKDASPKIQVNDDRIQKILLYIKKNITEQIDLDKLAQMNCMSKDHFIRIFKNETGETPMQYITQKKIERAELLLSTESIPVKNIAYSLGFDDHSYFNRLFKKIVGQTPLEYREKNHISVRK